MWCVCLTKPEVYFKIILNDRQQKLVGGGLAIYVSPELVVLQVFGQIYFQLGLVNLILKIVRVRTTKLTVKQLAPDRKLRLQVYRERVRRLKGG